MIPPTNQEVFITKKDLWLQVKVQHEQGCSQSEIAQQLGLDRKTVRKVLASETPPVYKKRVGTGSKLDPYREFLRIRVTKEGVTNVVKLKREIVAQGYQGGISILRDFIRPLRPAPADEAFIRFETMPGEQAQVDWGDLWGIDVLGGRRRLYCFTMVLGYSRCLYAEVTEHMDLTTLLRCHQHAFDYFGGVSRTILYDNMKQVILDRDDETRKLHFNPRFLDFAGHYSFLPKLCQPRRPQTKGKIESGVKYVKGNFWLGETYYCLAMSNGDLREWLDQVANVRQHGTTHERPFDRMTRERSQLQPLPAIPYDTSVVTSRVATKDCFVSYHGNRYSVPYQYVRKVLTIRDAGQGRIKVYAQEHLIATHELSLKKGRVILNPAHTAGLKHPQSANRGKTTAATEALIPGRSSTWRERRQAPVLLRDILPEVMAPLLEMHERSLKLYEQAAEEEVGGGEQS
jgi:transposase